MRTRDRQGFSLIEIVLAVGIVAFALVTIFGLFGSALRSSTDTLSEVEAINTRGSLSRFLQERSGGSNFPASYDLLKGESFWDLYAFSVNDAHGLAEQVVYRADDPDLPATSAARTGRLLRARVRVSPNFLLQGGNQTAGNLTAGDLPADVNSFSNAKLGVSVTVYDVPAVAEDVPSGKKPVFRYETTLSR